MAKAKKQTATNNKELSEFVDFSTNPNFEGVLFGVGKMTSNEDGKFFYYLKFDDGSKVGISTVLGKKISYYLNTRDVSGADLIGSQFTITYLGQRKTKSGRKVNLYELAINGELIDENEVKPNEIAELFQNDLPF